MYYIIDKQYIQNNGHNEINTKRINGCVREKDK